MSAHEVDLVAFLAGELEPEEARAFDNHLLTCESCWTALREDRAARAALELLRDTAPAGLADRVRLAVELQTSKPRRRGQPWKAITGLAALVVAGLVATLGTVLLSTHPPPSAVATVVHFARLIPSSPSLPAEPTTSGPLGRPVTLTSGGQPLELLYYRVGDTEALVATSSREFEMPKDGRPLGGPPGMAWTATRSGISLLCLNGPRSTLLAAGVPLQQLTALATQLRLR